MVCLVRAGAVACTEYENRGQRVGRPRRMRLERSPARYAQNADLARVIRKLSHVPADRLSGCGLDYLDFAIYEGRYCYTNMGRIRQTFGAVGFGRQGNVRG